MVTAQRGDHHITRNVSWFKRVSGQEDDTSTDADEADGIADHWPEPYEVQTNDPSSSIGMERTPEAGRLRNHLRPNPVMLLFLGWLRRIKPWRDARALTYDVSRGEPVGGVMGTR
ncbi:hypothetical protein NDU88_000766 [Pleurodeles waltl]|uniref:Uncharacterized protein n=1 Tax=Pleurodeles waltl TaxID=8319 RepID=A0AAV7S9K8_PLEWA|nr:hypothetical protein NDU88_000766 [Pleurodeles waltl]